MTTLNDLAAIEHHAYRPIPLDAIDNGGRAIKNSFKAVMAAADNYALALVTLCDTAGVRAAQLLGEEESVIVGSGRLPGPWICADSGAGTSIFPKKSVDTESIDSTIKAKLIDFAGKESKALGSANMAIYTKDHNGPGG